MTADSEGCGFRGGGIDCYEPPCPLCCDCLLKEALDGAYAAFFKEMDRYTLADFARMPALQRLVEIGRIG